MEAYQQLEVRFREWLQSRGYAGELHCVACSSGTAALHLALETIYFQFRYGVVVPEFSMIAAARSVVLADLEPVFADCNDRLLMTARTLRETIFSGDHVRAVMPVHVYGRQCDMAGISEVSQQHGCSVIEDLAEAHGVIPHPRTDAACWSFYRNKIIHGEEGGMVAFRDEALATRARQLRSMGWTEKHDCLHIPRAHNYRMANLLAEPILHSLSQVEINLRLRNEMAEEYDRWLPEEWRMPKRDVVWVYDLRIPGLTQQRQDRIVASLNARGITARHAFKPMSEQPEFQQNETDHLNAHRLSREVIYLPVDPDQMSIGDTRRNCEALLRIED